MWGLSERIQKAGAEISEALGASGEQPPAPAAPGQPPPMQPGPVPQPSPPPGSLAVQPPPQVAGPPAPQQPAARNPASPLSVMSDFRSPPLAAALQGARGRESQQPVGFARGGLAVFRGK